jgi:hypothetical protein
MGGRGLVQEDGDFRGRWGGAGMVDGLLEQGTTNASI